jgi:hypothetical protein
MSATTNFSAAQIGCKVCLGVESVSLHFAHPGFDFLIHAPLPIPPPVLCVMFNYILLIVTHASRNDFFTTHTQEEYFYIHFYVNKVVFMLAAVKANAMIERCQDYHAFLKKP